MTTKAYNPRLPMPAMGAGAYLHFNMNALIALEEKYGASYLETIDSALRQRNIRTMRECLTIALKDNTGTPDDCFDKMPVGSIAAAIADALALALFGKTLTDK